MIHVIKIGDQYGGRNFNSEVEYSKFMINKDPKVYVRLGSGVQYFNRKVVEMEQHFNIEEEKEWSKMLEEDLKINLQFQIDQGNAKKIATSKQKDYFAIKNGGFAYMNKVSGGVKSIKPIWIDRSFYITINRKLHNAGKLMWETFVGEMLPQSYIAFHDGNKKNFSIDNMYMDFLYTFHSTVPVRIWNDPMFPYTLRNLEDAAIKIGKPVTAVMEYIKEATYVVKGWNIEFLDPNEEYDFDTVWREDLDSEFDM